MTDIVAAVLIPTVGDPGGLLAPGRCGGYPPRCYLRVSGEWAEVRHATHRLPSTACALPLWWDGAPVPEGLDRARRVLAVAMGVAGIGATRAGEDLAHVIAIARRLDAAGLGHVVRLARVGGRLAEVG